MAMHDSYQICSRCVMDTTDPGIIFDEDGVCNHCRDYDRKIREEVKSGEEGRKKIDAVVKVIKESGRGKEYDCIIGVSGGIDSSYVAYTVHSLGLRPLAVHLDNGWDSELAVRNIEAFLKKLDIDLYTYVIDWEEFRDIQLAFLRASTPDSEIPSDHAIVAILHQVADQCHTPYLVMGWNVRTESHLPEAWSHGHLDWKYIQSVHQAFGHIPMKTFPHMGFFTLHRAFVLHKSINILNYIDYSRNRAMKILEDELGWQYYGGKHYESIYTRFYQGYILPRKFGYDKRRSHLSSLICSGEITRNDALVDLRTPPYDQDLQVSDREFVIKKLGITEEEFEGIMELPKKRLEDYPSYTNSIFSNPIYKFAVSKTRGLRGI